VRVWVDITDAAHVVFFAPIVRRLEDGGHTVTLTARRFAGADTVLRRYGLGGVLTTAHRGGGVGTRAVGLVNRTAQLLGSASSGRYDVAAGSHASDFVLTAWTLGIPQMTFLEDERLRRTNAVNLRLVDEVAVPESISTATLAAFGAPAEKLLRYPGCKEQYYLYDVRPDPEALARLGVDRRHIVGVVRPPSPAPPRASAARPAAPGTGEPARSAPPQADAPAGEATLAELVRTLAGRRNVTLVVVARDREQREHFLGPDAPRGLVVPDGPVDGVGLIAAADFVLGAGGALEREAAALGTPAYTIARRVAGAVDAALVAEGRIRPVADTGDLVLHKKDARTAQASLRDPSLFVDALLQLARHRSRRARLGRLMREAGDSGPEPLV
jgi:predicted glycosyltransferase